MPILLEKNEVYILLLRVWVYQLFNLVPGLSWTVNVKQSLLYCVEVSMSLMYSSFFPSRVLNLSNVLIEKHRWELNSDPLREKLETDY